MPGTVSDVSATLVASTMRRPRCGAKTLCCSAIDRRAYSGTISVARPGAARPGGRVERPITDLYGVGPPADLDDRRTAEVGGEPLGRDGGRGDHDLEVGPAGQEL